ncbi:MAG: HNH endonuclease [Thermodesulfovibrionales bacterium]|nr:HNH endonuclease [Thermodesulfovibrionales bacterium]
MQILKSIKAFKHHYFKIRKIATKLAKKGSLKLKISISDNIIDEELFTPENYKTVQFVVLMRRFLDQKDNLYYKNVWGLLNEHFADVLPQETIKYFEKFDKQMIEGDIGININGESLTAEKIYQILADGEYFGNSRKAQVYLKYLKEIPIIGALFWYKFHTYTMDGFKLAQFLFDTIVQIKNSSKFKNLIADDSQYQKQCIYCLSISGKFTSEEHIFPESLGNDELILQKGFVCDECNNGILSCLDDFLLKFEPVAFLQVHFVPYKKNGQLPSANFQNLSIKRTTPKNIAIKTKDKSAFIIHNKYSKTGEIDFTISIKGKKFDAKMLGRALYKIALGMVAFDQGHEIACDSKFDSARNFIMKGQGFSNNILIKKEGTPHPKIRVAHNKLFDCTPFVIDIFGLFFLLNLELQPLLNFNKIITQEQFFLYSLEK